MASIRAPARPLGPVRRRRRHRPRRDRRRPPSRSLATRLGGEPRQPALARRATGRVPRLLRRGRLGRSTGCCSRRRSSTRSPIGRSPSPSTRTSPRSASGLAGVHGAAARRSTRRVPFSLPQIAVPGLAPYAPLWRRGRPGRLLPDGDRHRQLLRPAAIGQRAWRLLHYLTFLAFVGATAHGLGAGTDSGAAWAWWIYVGSTVAVVFLFGYRVVMSIGARRADVGRALGTPRQARASTRPEPRGRAA